MNAVFTCSQARRRLRRLIALVATGHTFVITKNGRAMRQLGGVDSQELRRSL